MVNSTYTHSARCLTATEPTLQRAVGRACRVRRLNDLRTFNFRAITIDARWQFPADGGDVGPPHKTTTDARTCTVAGVRGAQTLQSRESLSINANVAQAKDYAQPYSSDSESRLLEWLCTRLAFLPVYSHNRMSFRHMDACTDAIYGTASDKQCFYRYFLYQESHAVAGKPRDAAVNSDRYRVCRHFAGAISVSRMQSVSGCTVYA